MPSAQPVSTNAFAKNARLANPALPTNPWLPSIALINVAFALSAKAWLPDKFPTANVGALWDKKLAFKTARAVELIVLDVLDLVLLKDWLLHEN